MIETSETKTVEQSQHQPPRRRCPICGYNVVVTVKYSQVILDYHHDKRAGYIKWCAGSDLNLSEATA